VQFHPESIATEYGHELLANFLKICGIKAKEAA
jgi:anthranilate synthase component 2